MKKSNRKILKITLFACFLFSCLPVQPVFACEPYPEYWFIETITFTAQSLPENVSLYATDPNRTPRAAFWIYNTNQDPVFILPRTSLEQIDDSNISPNSVEKLSMEMVNAQNSPIVLEMDRLIVLDDDLEDPNPVNMNRPASETLSIPEPQYSELVLVYQAQIITAPFTVTYSINPHNSVANCQQWYQISALTEEARAQIVTTAEVEQTQGPNGFSLTPFFVIVLIILGVVIISWLVRRLLRLHGNW